MAASLRAAPPGADTDPPGRTAFWSVRAIGCAEQSGADRIGPQHPRAVDRPQPCRESARCMYRQPWIADASQLKFRVIHRSDMTGEVAVARRWRQISAARHVTALTER